MADDPTQWQIKKFCCMLRYLVEQYPNKVKTRPRIQNEKLHRLCYLCDFDYYESNGCSITGSTYVHGRNGPVPIYFDKAVKELVTDDIVKSDGKYVISCSNRTYLEEMYSCEFISPTEVNLLPDEIETINFVLERFAFKTISQLNALTKDDTAWILSGDCQALNYGFAYYRPSSLSLRRNEDE